MEVKFLAYVLNVKHRSVMHIISYANVVYFIAHVYNNCVDCSSKWKVDMLRHRVHVMAQGREMETFKVFQESSAIYS